MEAVYARRLNSDVDAYVDAVFVGKDVTTDDTGMQSELQIDPNSWDEKFRAQLIKTLVNIFFQFQTLISEKQQFFVEIFFQQKISGIWI